MSLAAGLYPGSRDYPLQVPKGPVEVPYEAITDEELQALQDELEEENQRGLLYLLDYCFEVSRQMPQLLQPADFRPLLTPIRRYLIRGRDLETYDRLLRYLRKIAEGGIYPPALTEQAAEMLQECCELDALSAVVATASGDDVLEDIAWDILQQLLPDLAQRDVLVLLGHAMSEHMSNILAATLIQSTGADLGLYEEALEGESVAAALAGLRCLATLRTPKAVLLIEQAVWRPENLVKRGALRILGRVPPGETTPKALLKGLRDSDPEVRDEALDAVDRQAISDMASSVGRWFEEVGFSKMDEEKRLQFARILCDLDREYAANYFGDKIKINVLTKFGGATTAAEMEWNLLAAEGLALAATKGAIEKLREVRTKGDKKFRDRVTRLAVEARRRARE